MIASFTISGIIGAELERFIAAKVSGRLSRSRFRKQAIKVRIAVRTWAVVKSAGWGKGDRDRPWL